MRVLCFSDGLLSGLEACDPFPFATSKLGPVSVDVWLSIIKLTGLTGDVSFFIVIYYFLFKSNNNMQWNLPSTNLLKMKSSLVQIFWNLLETVITLNTKITSIQHRDLGKNLDNTNFCGLCQDLWNLYTTKILSSKPLQDERDLYIM